MRTHQIYNPRNSEARKAAQDLLDQAEEDMLCAVTFLRMCNQHRPVNEICYIFHQAIEKWIKVVLQMSFGKFIKSHYLEKDLIPPAIETIPELQQVSLILDDEPILKSKNYPDSVRYRGTESYDLDRHLILLRDASFLTRRLIKRWLKDREVIL